MSKIIKNEVEIMSPQELVNFNRFDIFAKTLFLKKGHHKFFENLYKQQLFCSTAGTFTEFDNPEKCSFEKFKKVFREINDAIASQSFDWYKSPIVLDQDDNLVNGAHRLAGALCNNAQVGVIRVNSVAQVQSLDFFYKNGLNDEYVKRMLVEASELAKYTRLGVIWGVSETQRDQILNHLTDVIWKKEIRLSERGKSNIVELIYKDEPWVYDNNNKVGIYYKSVECFKFSNLVTFFVIDERGKNLDALKAKIRKSIGLGKHAIHICDDHRDSLRILEVVCNDNSVHLINTASSTFWQILEEKVKLQLDQIENYDQFSDEILIDGTACLELYGLRTASDIDLMSTSEAVVHSSLRKEKDNFHVKSKEDLIYDPHNHLLFNGWKFVSLENLYRFKMARREQKDEGDVKLIKKILVTPRYSYDPKQMVRRQWYKHKAVLIKLLKDIGVYEKLRRMILGR